MATVTACSKASLALGVLYLTDTHIGVCQQHAHVGKPLPLTHPLPLFTLTHSHSSHPPTPTLPTHPHEGIFELLSECSVNCVTLGSKAQGNFQGHKQVPYTIQTPICQEVIMERGFIVSPCPQPTYHQLCYPHPSVSDTKGTHS